jgi:hypothetical protein
MPDVTPLSPRPSTWVPWSPAHATEPPAEGAPGEAPLAKYSLRQASPRQACTNPGGLPAWQPFPTHASKRPSRDNSLPKRASRFSAHSAQSEVCWPRALRNTVKHNHEMTQGIFLCHQVPRRRPSSLSLPFKYKALRGPRKWPILPIGCLVQAMAIGLESGCNPMSASHRLLQTGQSPTPAYRLASCQVPLRQPLQNFPHKTRSTINQTAIELHQRRPRIKLLACVL